MKKWMAGLSGLVMWATISGAAPMRVALMDFTDSTGGSTDAWLGGKVSAEQLATKGVFALSKSLIGKGDFTLVDRRDFMNQMQKMVGSPEAQASGIRPSYIQAAQALRCDAVLRGELQTFSVGKETVRQSGYAADFATVSVRVGIEAVDAVDGSVLAVVEGVAVDKFRQTDALKTELGEDEVYQMLQAAVNKAAPELVETLKAKLAANDMRETVALSVTTTDNPAMVEVDGILVGTTPMEELEIYKGDHVLTITRPGYQPITKRLVLDKATSISAPMLRLDLTPEERIKVLEGADMRIYMNEGGKPDLVIQTIE